MAFRPRSIEAKAIWAVFVVGIALVMGAFILVAWRLRLKPPSPSLISVVIVMVIVTTLLNRIRTLGLDPAGLHIGSPDQGYVVPWSNVRGVVTVPRSLFQPERLRIRIADSSLAPGWWARLRWGVRVRPGSELELVLGHRKAGSEIATEIRHFIDAYA
jgi:hypothetical protein